MRNIKFSWLWFLALSITLHLLLFLPERKSVSTRALPPSVIKVSLLQSAAKPIDSLNVSEPPELPPRTTIPPSEVAPPKPVEPETGVIVAEEIDPQAATPEPDVTLMQPVVSARILSSQFHLELKNSNPFANQEADEAEVPALGLAELPLANSLREPTPLRLPFADTRIYLVDSYSAGVSGKIERFFDRATVPFGWTTDGGTRVQCAWVMILAACSWGDKELFYRKARRRNDDDS